jgi:hypothetical protein
MNLCPGISPLFDLGNVFATHCCPLQLQRLFPRESRMLLTEAVCSSTGFEAYPRDYAAFCYVVQLDMKGRSGASRNISRLPECSNSGKCDVSLFREILTRRNLVLGNQVSL